MALSRVWPIVRRDIRNTPVSSEDGWRGDHPCDPGVLRRGSLRAAEEQTGHNDETIALWLQRLGDQAVALTKLFVHDQHMSEVELDELWSFVGRKGGASHQASRVIRGDQKAPANGGAA